MCDFVSRDDPRIPSPSPLRSFRARALTGVEVSSWTHPERRTEDRRRGGKSGGRGYSPEVLERKGR